MALQDFYFASFVAWRLHPGWSREGAAPPTLEEMADLVDQVMEVREKRWPQSQEQQ